MLWTVMGCVGVVGALAGWLIARVGMPAVHLGFHLALALAVVAVAWSGASPALVYVGGGLFGASYLMLTGVYLVWGISALPERPAAAVTLAFLALAVGQTLGSIGFGLLLEHVAADGVVLGFAALALVAGVVRRRPT